MSKFFKPEERELLCEDCNHDRFIVSYAMDVLPQVLVIHVKRFQYNSHLARYTKCHTPVIMEPIIDISTFCTAGVTNAPMHDLGPPCTTPPPPLPKGSRQISSSSISADISPMTPLRSVRATKGGMDSELNSGLGQVNENTNVKRKQGKRKRAIEETRKEKLKNKKVSNRAEWGRSEDGADYRDKKKGREFTTTPDRDSATRTTKERLREEMELKQVLELSKKEYHQDHDQKQKAAAKAAEEEDKDFLRQIEAAKNASMLETAKTDITCVSPSSSSSSTSSSSSSSTAVVVVDVVDVSSPSELEKNTPTITTSTTNNQVRFVSKQNQASPPSTQYSLQCVVRHSGRDAFAGHYTTDVCQPDETWTRYNDARVQKKIQLHDIIQGEKNSKECYILYYEKINPQQSNKKKKSVDGSRRVPIHVDLT